jgi:hypothetical protein
LYILRFCLFSPRSRFWHESSSRVVVKIPSFAGVILLATLHITLVDCLFVVTVITQDYRASRHQDLLAARPPKRLEPCEDCKRLVGTEGVEGVLIPLSSWAAVLTAVTLDTCDIASCSPV